MSSASVCSASQTRVDANAGLNTSPGAAPFVQQSTPGPTTPPGIAQNGQPDPWQAYRDHQGPSATDPNVATNLPPFVTNHLLVPPDPKDKKHFSDKVAVTTGRQFDGVNEGGAWRNWCRNYLISQAIEMDFLLRTTEASEDREITTPMLQAMTASWIHPARVHNRQASHD